MFRLLMDKDAGDGKGGGGSDHSVETIVVGDRNYSAEDIQGMAKELGNLKPHEKTIAQLGSVAQGLGLSIDEFGNQGFAALRVINDLIDTGVIDETGKVIDKKVEIKNLDKNQNDEDKDLFNLVDDKLTNDVKGKNTDSTKLTELIEKALAPFQEQFDKVNARIEKTEAVNTGLLERDFSSRIIAKFNNLTPEDVTNVFARARGDRSKDVWSHAEEVSEAKANAQIESNKAFCVAHGLNYDELNENLLKEQESTGGAPPSKEGTTITFRKGVKGGVSPGELAADYLSRKIR